MSDEYNKTDRVSRGLDIGTCGGCIFWAKMSGKFGLCTNSANLYYPPVPMPPAENVQIEIQGGAGYGSSGSQVPLNLQGTVKAVIVRTQASYSPGVQPPTTDLTTCSLWEPKTPGVL